MKNLAIVLASLCVLASATSVFQTPSFIQLKKDPFGFSVASLVEMNMKSGQNAGALDAVAEVLNQLSASFTSQTESTESTILEQRAWCDDQLTTVSANLNAAKSDLQTYREEQKDLISQQETSSDNLNQELNDLQVNEDSQQKAVDALTQENARFDQSVVDYNNAITAIQEALQLLYSLQTTPASFIQSKSHFGNVVSLLSKHLANKGSPLVEPILSVLTELATSTSLVDQDKIAKCIQLIEELLGDLRNQSAENVTRHEESVSQLNETANNLDTLIENSKQSVDNYNSSLEQTNLRLEQLSRLITEDEILISTFSDELASNKATCDGYEVVYIQKKARIDSQTQVLQQVKEYFLNHIVHDVQQVDDQTYQDTLTVNVA